MSSFATRPEVVTTAVRQSGGRIVVNGSIDVFVPTRFANGLIVPSPNVVVQLMPGRGGRWRGVPQPIT